MGVKELWSVISPVCEKKSLWELENKVIAIDLSAWICDSQSVHTSQVNMYLRNIFFRTSYLLLLGVKPVFVLEGKAPDLKTTTIRNRLNKGKDCTEGRDKTVTRSRLSALQKQCVDLLGALGVKCVKGPGEAEAFCAHLNRLGIADGIITQDSDVFLYGAKEVYRNFQMSPNYTCDHYSMRVIEEKLGLTRSKLVGYSLLVGSDYNNGIQKLGKQDALKFILSIPDGEIIQRFVNWRNDSFFEQFQQKKYLNNDFALEMKIREKCIKDQFFPDLEVVTEYMSEPKEVELTYEWEKPNLAQFVGIAVKKLMWEEDYAIEKFVPLLGRWHLQHPASPSDLQVRAILSVPTGKYAYCYKVSWNKYNLTTVEPKEFVAKAYPQLVSSYEESRNAKRRKTGKKLKKQVSTDDKKEEINEVIPNFSEKLLERNDCELDLSAIIESIITRPLSNPAIEKFS